MQAFGLEDAHRRRDKPDLEDGLPEIHADYVFMGGKGVEGILSGFHAVDRNFGVHLLVLRLLHQHLLWTLHFS